MTAIDQVRLSFDPTSLTVLGGVLGLVMFGVALDLRLADFRRVVREPRGPLAGMVAQFVLLPAGTFVLTRLLAPPPSIALGMILVAACPGGNMSNFLTHLAGGRTALSIGMTALSTVAAIVMTPLNVALWGGLHPSTAALLQELEIDPAGMFVAVLGMLGLPLVLGMWLAAKAPRAAARLRRPFKAVSVGFFVLFVASALVANRHALAPTLGYIFLPVLLQNTMAFLLGWGLGRLAGLDAAGVRAVCIEVGIQNSGLGLVLVFSFFKGLGGMAAITAWWGIWHVVAGLALAAWWARRPALMPVTEVDS